MHALQCRHPFVKRDFKQEFLDQNMLKNTYFFGNNYQNCRSVGGPLACGEPPDNFFEFASCAKCVLFLLKKSTT